MNDVDDAKAQGAAVINEDGYLRALENIREAIGPLDRDTAQATLIAALAEHVAYDDRYEDDPANSYWSEDLVLVIQGLITSVQTCLLELKKAANVTDDAPTEAVAAFPTKPDKAKS
jgi:hypothetical protein